MTIASTPPPASPPPAKLIEASLAWWQEAGVDCVFANAPQSWLAPDPSVTKTPRKPRVPKALPAASPLDRAFAGVKPHPHGEVSQQALPGDLEQFQKWWVTSPELNRFSKSPRCRPMGRAEAPLMLVVTHPDRETGEMLSATHQMLVDALLAAFGLTSDDIYLATALPGYDPMPDWHGAAQQGLGAIMTHHVTLAKPGRVLALGRGMAPVFNVALDDAREPGWTGDDNKTPLLLAPDLRELCRSATRRKAFWTRWLEWTA